MSSSEWVDRGKYSERKRWLVTKTVTEYHTFMISAATEEQALTIAEDHDNYYCDRDNADDTVVEVQSAKEVVE